MTCASGLSGEHFALRRGSQSLKVRICGVPYLMQIVDGGVLFSKKSNQYEASGRFMFSYRNGLWWLEHAESTFGHVAALHLQGMHELLCEKIGHDHEDFPLRFKYVK